MKVLHLCKVYLPTQGGVQVVIDWISKGLDGKKWSSHVLSTAESEESFIDSTGTMVENCRSFGEIFSLPMSPSILPRFLRTANQYDVVCVHYPFPIADLAVALMFKRNFALIIYWHSEIVTQKFSSYLLSPFTKILLSRADRIICSSPPLLEHSKLLKAHHAKCVIVPFGNPNTEENESSLEPPSQSNYLLFIGRHVPYKGICVLINAFSQFKSANPSSKTQLKLVGNGPLIEKHRRLAMQLGIHKSIKFFTSADDAAVKSLIQKCRCFVLPSILPSEAFALVQLESMCFGRPIINTRLRSGVPWVARDGIEAITVSPNDVMALGKAIECVANDDELVDKLGAKSKDRAESVFDFGLFSQTTQAVYENAVIAHRNLESSK